MQKLIDIESQLNKSELALTTRFANLIKGNEIDLEMFDRMFRNVEDANALAILKNQLAEIATSTLQSGINVSKQEPSKRKYSPSKSTEPKPTASKKETDKEIKKSVDDLGSGHGNAKDEDTFDL